MATNRKLILVAIATTFMLIVSACSSSQEPETAVLGVTEISSTTTVTTLPTTTVTTPPTTTESTTTTTTTSTTTTTTVPVVPPPASGFYIVPEEFYEDGIPLLFRINDSLIDWSIGFNLPVGAEIRSPISGIFFHGMMGDFVGNGHNAGSVEKAAVGLNGLQIEDSLISRSFTVAGGGIELLVESGAVVSIGDVIGRVIDSSIIVDMSPAPEFNTFITLTEFEESVGFSVGNEKFLREYFSYIEES